jgi:hypothetical protein
MATDIETIPGFDLIIPLQLTYPNFTSNNKTDRHDIAEILLKVALNIITLTAFSMSQQIVNHDSFCNKYNIATAGVDLIKMA